MSPRAALRVFVLICLAAAPIRGAAQSTQINEAVRTATVIIDGVTLFAVRGTSALPAEERAKIVRQRTLDAARDPAFDPRAIELRPVEGGIEVRSKTMPLRGVFDADARLEGLETACSPPR